MKVLHGRQIKDFREAAELAFRDAGVDDMRPSVADLFKSVIDITKQRSEAEKAITNAIRGRYKGNPTWEGTWWYIAVPNLGYDTRGTPHITIDLKTYLVAGGEVGTADRCYPAALVGSIGKPETLAIPMVFLHALLEKDLGRFAVVARDAANTTWEVQGAKPVRLPNDFISELTETLRWKSVVAWLLEFGPQGRCVAPLVVGSLLGLQFQDSTQPVPVTKQGWTPDDLVSALESMAFRHSEAREMVNRATPRLRGDITLEEAIRFTLQTGKGGD